MILIKNYRGNYLNFDQIYEAEDTPAGIYATIAATVIFVPDISVNDLIDIANAMGVENVILDIDWRTLTDEEAENITSS